MRHAIRLACKAQESCEVPVGALVVCENEIIGEGFNSSIALDDPTAHAECLALRNAASARGNYRLPGTAMYVTIEPCLMCIGAMIQARVEVLVYGAPEPKSGAVKSNLKVLEFSHLNHLVSVRSGVLADECKSLMQSFFQARR